MTISKTLSSLAFAFLPALFAFSACAVENSDDPQYDFRDDGEPVAQEQACAEACEDEQAVIDECAMECEANIEDPNEQQACADACDPME